MKKKKLDGDGFPENQKKKKVNLVVLFTKKKTHGSVNRNMLKTRDKRKDKINKLKIATNKLFIAIFLFKTPIC
jgi:ATP-dependent RNA helicase RhlE